MKPSSQSERLAEALRAEPPELDEVTRARMERDWLTSVNEVAEERASRGGRGRSRAFVSGLALGLAAAAAVAVIIRWGGSEVEPSAIAGDSVERWSAAGAVSAAPLEPGDVVRTDGDGHARLRFGDSRVEVGVQSVLVAERLGRDVRMRLDRGEVRVEFNPAHPGQEGFVVETASARVEVVGTAFEVSVGADGATRVRVSHGVVRVTPLPFGRSVELRAGDELEVPRREVSRSAEPRPTPAAVGPGAAEGPPRARPAPETAPAVGAEGRGEVARASSLDDGVLPDPEPTELDPQATADPATAVEGEAAESHPTSSVPSTPIDADARFALAARLLEQNRLAEARHELYAVVRASGRVQQARAWSLVADSRERERDWAAAAEAYRRATQAAPGSVYGRTALFSLARLRELRLDDPAGARHAYRSYLSRPDAPLAEQARHGLCRLGDLSRCRAGEEPAERPPSGP